MKRPSRIQNVPARPPTSKTRAGQTERPGPKKANPVGKAHAGTRPAAVPKDPIQQARQDAAAAEADVIRISRAHLATLMASPPRQRMAHLTDPELTAADRTELENSLRAVLPRRAPVKAAPSTAPAYLRRLLRGCGYKCAVTIVLLTVGALLAGTAWHNTGKRMVGSNTTWTVDWRLPDGDRIPIEERGGEEVSHMTGQTAAGLVETVRITPEDSPVANWAFDVTPGRLLTGLITERGVCPATTEGLARLYGREPAPEIEHA